MTLKSCRVTGLDWKGIPTAVTIRDGRIVDVDVTAADTALAAGRTLLPALWDHHVHLRAAAARAHSIDVSAARSTTELETILASATRPHHGSVRAVGWDDTRAGPLDLLSLDAVTHGMGPVRVQHRSGHLWVVNSSAAAVLHGVGVHVPEDGKLWDRDADLARAFSASIDPVALLNVAQALVRRGVVGVDDMTPTAGDQDIGALAEAVSALLTVSAFGSPEASPSHGAKILLKDHALTTPDDLAKDVGRLRPRRVALHAVSAEALALVASISEDLLDGDRIEHAFITPAEIPAHLCAGSNRSPAAIRIGVHPGFMRTHGDRHRRNGTAMDIADYLRLRTWRAAGATLLGGTDLPFGPADPWVAMHAAVDRRTAEGVVLGGDEALSPEEAFVLFAQNGLGGGEPTLDLRVGDSADVCIIHGPWSQARTNLTEVEVIATLRGGAVTHLADAFADDLFI